MTLLDAIAAWLPHQRWYATKHLVADLAIAELRNLDGPYQLAFVTDSAPDQPVTYQVPIAVGEEPPDNVPVVGKVGGQWVWDACGDIGFQALRLGLTSPVPVRVLSGEQSNTSVICDLSNGTVITKVFRVLQDGPNPEVELTKALAEAGCQSVPAFVSALYDVYPGGQGHLQVTNEFIPDAVDAWRDALDSAREGRPFEAHELGATVGEVHSLLKRVFGVVDADPTTVVSGWRQRAAHALQTVPELRNTEPLIERVYKRALEGPWPQLQRIHGDLHLGQVIHSARGWVLLDFEGEPLRPLHERRQADLALRDVAGMLRSFDYAEVSAGSKDSRWAERSREEFLTGYASAGGEDPQEYGALLSALELDKALYEAVYEATNRPDWLRVPLAGIDHLLEHHVRADSRTERMGE